MRAIQHGNKRLRRFSLRSLCIIAIMTVSFASLFALSARAQIGIDQKAAVEKIIREYIKRNPEIIRDALIELDIRAKAKETDTRAQAVTKLAPKIYFSKHQVVLGNPKGKIQFVEFYDYNCGYCRRAMKDLDQILKNNEDVRVVLKDFAILGPPSIEAARVSIAVANQISGQKYWQYHSKLMRTRGQANMRTALAMAKEMGVDMKKLKQNLKSAEIDIGLREVREIANALGMTGTPSYVIGNEIVVGAVGISRLQEKINNLRKCGKTKCP